MLQQHFIAHHSFFIRCHVHLCSDDLLYQLFAPPTDSHFQINIMLASLAAAVAQSTFPLTQAK